MSDQQFSKGLEGVVAGRTAVSEVTQQGLRYRGYDISDLAENTTFEEVAHLLLHGELPSPSELAAFKQRLAEFAAVPTQVVGLLKSLPKDTPAMDMLRSAVSVLAHFDPDTADSSPAANLRKSERLLTQIAVVIGAWARILAGAHQPIAYDGGMSHAANLLRMILGKKPDEPSARAMDVTLILYAEHEFNASTFASRVTTGTMADIHAAITSAIGTLKGPLHGGANEAATHMLLEIGSPDNAQQWLATALKEKKKIMGFGHRVYKHGDHRAKILKGWSRKVAQVKGQTKWIDMSDIIEAGMDRQKNIFPNLDFPCASLFYVMGLPIDLYTPLFVASRITGWCAHVMEQTQDNRLIRPTSEYIGPGIRKVVPLARR